MFPSPNSPFRAATLVGAGWCMVAYGASESVGLIEPAEAVAEEEEGRSEPLPFKVGPKGDLARGLGHRPEVRLFRGG